MIKSYLVKMVSVLYRLLIINTVAAMLLAGCASIPSDVEEPSLTITSIALKNLTGLTPEFDITLHITNPNRDALNIVGMSYKVYLEDNKVVSGVSNDFPVIEPYGEAEVKLNAMISLLGSINLLRDLTQQKLDAIDYAFVAKMDIGRSQP